MYAVCWLVTAVYVLRWCSYSAEYCDERVCLSLCVFVCPRSYLRNYTFDLQQIFVHVNRGRDSVLL